MSDLISRQAAVEAFRKELCKEREYAISFKGCESVLNGLPTAEPTVRCKDCRYYMPKTHSCTMASLMCPDETDFCSRGKKVEVVYGD